MYEYDYGSFNFGKLTFGFQDLLIKDVILYSNEKTWHGKICMAIKLFFRGKGIVTEKELISRLEHHPERTEIFEKYFFLITVFKIQTIASDTLAYHILNLPEGSNSKSIEERATVIINVLSIRKSIVSKSFAVDFEIMIRSVTSACEHLLGKHLPSPLATYKKENKPSTPIDFNSVD